MGPLFFGMNQSEFPCLPFLTGTKTVCVPRRTSLTHVSGWDGFSDSTCERASGDNPQGSSHRGTVSHRTRTQDA